MSISLLYKNEADKPEIGDKVFEYDKSLIYDLSIDRAMMTVCVDAPKREKFLAVVAKPLLDSEAIVYRQQILTEFMGHPGLFRGMMEFFTTYKGTQTRWDDERRAVMSKRSNGTDKKADLYTSTMLLNTTGRYLKVILSYVRTLFDTLSGFSVSSEGLFRLRSYCADIVRSETYSELETLAERCRTDFVDADYSDILLEFGADLRLNVCDYASENVFLRPPAEKRKIGFLGPKKKEETEVKYTGAREVNANGDPDAITELLLSSCRALDQTLTQVARKIYHELSGISSELEFFEVAVSYVEKMRDRGADMCYPRILGMEYNVLYCESLKDVMLLLESINPAMVIPNDVGIDGIVEGMLIRGENNSGKTVYLRSVGTALLFAQAGLMIPAKKAEISVRRALYSHFASAEESGISAGRFEQEVRDLSEIIDKLVPNSMFFLNETFQTTSYDEGAEGIYPILNHIRSLGGGVIFVTHLHKLFEMYNDDPQICFRKTSGKKETQYKIGEYELPK